MEIRLTCTVSIPGFYQPSEVAAQYKFLGQTPYGAKRSRELHAVHHRGSRRILAELMNMAEPLERTPYLLIYEVGGFLHLGDPVRHLKWDAEMPSTPGHFFV